jgi:hypothetical protein
MGRAAWCRFGIVGIAGIVLALAVLPPASADHTYLRLPSIGASKKAWKHTHRPDRKYAKDCCYLPRVQSDAETSPGPTWATVFFGDPPKKRVYLYTRNFQMGTDEAVALGLLRQDDLPRDAVPVWEKVDGACKILQLSSKRLRRVNPSSRGGVQVTLVSYADETPYTSSQVREAIVMKILDLAPEDARC